MPKPKLKDIVVLALAIIVLIMRYYHLGDGVNNVLGPLLGFYIGHRTSGQDTGV